MIDSSSRVMRSVCGRMIRPDEVPSPSPDGCDTILPETSSGIGSVRDVTNRGMPKHPGSDGIRTRIRPIWWCGKGRRRSGRPRAGGPRGGGAPAGRARPRARRWRTIPRSGSIAGCATGGIPSTSRRGASNGFPEFHGVSSRVPSRRGFHRKPGGGALPPVPPPRAA
jgi:hypothetical protein